MQDADTGCDQNYYQDNMCKVGNVISAYKMSLPHLKMHKDKFNEFKSNFYFEALKVPYLRILSIFVSVYCFPLCVHVCVCLWRQWYLC